MKKALALLLAGVFTLVLFAACSSSQAPSALSGASSQSQAITAVQQQGHGPLGLRPITGRLVDGKLAPESFNSEILENPDGTPVKIALVMLENPSPFWAKVGRVAALMAPYMKENYNCQIDVIPVNEFSGELFYDTVIQLTNQDYDAICSTSVGDALAKAIDEATAKGIHVYLYNSDVRIESSRVAFFGQDLYAAGVKAGEAMAQEMGGKGKVAIITGSYAMYAFEQRRLGAESVFEQYPDIEVVGVTQCHDSADEAYTQTLEFLSANPDLSGVLLVSSGSVGVAKAIEEKNVIDQVTFVTYDFYKENNDMTRQGIISLLIDQDPFGQVTDALIAAYNHVLTGTPTKEGVWFSRMVVATPETIDALTVNDFEY